MNDILYPLFKAASLVADLAVLPFGLVLIVAGLACGISRRPWYMAPFLAAIYTAVTIGYGLSGTGHGFSSQDTSLHYGQYLWAYTVIPLLAYGLGRWIGRGIAPGQAEMRGPGRMQLVIALTVAAVIATAYGIAYLLRP